MVFSKFFCIQISLIRRLVNKSSPYIVRQAVLLNDDVLLSDVINDYAYKVHCFDEWKSKKKFQHTKFESLIIVVENYINELRSFIACEIV